MGHVVTLTANRPGETLRAEARPIRRAAEPFRSATGTCLHGLAALSIKAIIGLSAGAYLVVHTVAESKWWRRLRHETVEPPLEIVPSEKLDAVDQASWESFPASDSPGF